MRVIPPAPIIALSWFVKTSVTPEGHEILVRDAAKEISDFNATGVVVQIIRGVREPDTASLRGHFLPSEQKRHVLRSTMRTPVRVAVEEAKRHLGAIHAQIRQFGKGPVKTLWLIGESLHLIQDGFAPAHVQRDAGGRISYVRYFGTDSPGAPWEHGLLRRRGVVLPGDARDNVKNPSSGGLRPEAESAIVASREYLDLVSRTVWRQGTSADAKAKFDDFVMKYFRV